MVGESGQAHRHNERWHFLVLLIKQDTRQIRLPAVDRADLFEDLETREQIAEDNHISALGIAFGQKNVRALHRLTLFNGLLENLNRVDPRSFEKLAFEVEIAVLSDLDIVGEYLLNQRIG